MDISIYFEPIENLILNYSEEKHQQRLGEIIVCNQADKPFPSIENADIAIIGVEEDRNAIDNDGCRNAPDTIRHFLYKLFPSNHTPTIVDLGNIKKGHTINDTYFALCSAMVELIQNNVVPIIIGGSHDLTFAAYQAYEKLQQIINIATIDNCFDLGDADRELNSQSYLSQIILKQPNFLFNYTNIGYQTYFVNPESINLMKNLFFDTYRLGVVREDIEEIEPLIRNADMLSIDISSIRMSDAPGCKKATPNGFYGEEVCQIARYAGLSDKLSSIGFYEMNPSFDKQGQTAHLVAQMIWYFIEGFQNRKLEFPLKDISNFVKFTVNLESNPDGIVFYKSKISDRWWMEVNCDANIKQKYKRHFIIPCSYKDYQTACENDIPDRWWQAFQKLM